MPKSTSQIHGKMTSHSKVPIARAINSVLLFRTPLSKLLTGTIFERYPSLKEPANASVV